MSNENSHPRSGSGHSDSHRSIIRSMSIMSAGTLTSRILGFLRDIVLAKFFGTGIRADAFFVAFKIPNLFRDFVGEGATNSAVVPVFNEYLVKKERAEFWQFVNVMLIYGLIVLSVITVAGILLAPWIVRVIAPGFMADPEKLGITIRLTKLMFPYLILIGLTAHSMAILFTFRSFVAPAFAPCFLNIAVIISALVSTRYMKEPIYGLAAGVLAGGVLQLLFQVRPLLRTGIQIRRPTTLIHPGAIRIGKLLVPRVMGAGVYQMTVLIDTFCASLAMIVGAGGISAVYYSNRIIQFPMGIFTVALASAVLPTFSGLATNNNIDQLKKTLVFTLENIFFLLFPTSIMAMILAQPVITVLFERGEFGDYSTQITSSALFWYALGLFSFGGIKILVTAFHALQDTKTPVKVAAVCLVVNGLLNFILMYPLKIGGIALATSIAATLDFLMLYYFLEKKIGRLRGGLMMFAGKVLIATAATGAAVSWMWSSLPVPQDILKLAVAGTAGFLIYGVLCYVLKVQQAHKIYQWMRTLGTKQPQ